MVKNHAAKEAARRLKAETGITYPRALDIVRTAGSDRAPESAPPRFDDLGLPDAVRSFATVSAGLHIFAGLTGSGTSTSLAAVLNLVAARYRRRITVIEDTRELPVNPGRSDVEFVTGPGSMHEAVDAAVRAVREVIVVGEANDAATLFAALHAANSGHTVFLTVHAASAEDVARKILDASAPVNAAENASLLGATLRSVLFQKLLPAADGRARVPAVEVLTKLPMEKFTGGSAPDAFIEWFRRQPGDTIPLAVSLSQLALDGIIDERTAETAIDNPMDFRRALHAGRRHSAPFITLGAAGADDVRTRLDRRPHVLVFGAGEDRRKAAMDCISGQFPGQVVQVSTEAELDAVTEHVESVLGKLNSHGASGFAELPEEVRPERCCVLVDLGDDPEDLERVTWPTRLSQIAEAAGRAGVMLLVGAVSREELIGGVLELRKSHVLDVDGNTYAPYGKDPSAFAPAWEVLPSSAG